MHPPIPYRVQSDDIDQHQHGGIDPQQQSSTDRQQKVCADRQQQTSSDRQPPMTYRKTEKTNQQHAYAPEQEKSTPAETSFIDDWHPMDEHEAIMDHQAAKERISIWKGAQSRKIYFPKHLRRESNGAGLDGFRKRVKKVPKDMTFEDAYHKLGSWVDEMDGRWVDLIGKDETGWEDGEDGRLASPFYSN
ncbi:hypothetical protein DY000_02016264 [Brassica cretica]|uniref:Uncharacterized protein n=1 Tax=Brassica cretica TaxID=69181 RepID=A0ABQ7D2L3_BRACR|nr:hypothetical protein DY000_02016264 [Brassica cretica]